MFIIDKFSKRIEDMKTWYAFDDFVKSKSVYRKLKLDKINESRR